MGKTAFTLLLRRSLQTKTVRVLVQHALDFKSERVHTSESCVLVSGLTPVASVFLVCVALSSFVSCHGLKVTTLLDLLLRALGSRGAAVLGQEAGTAFRGRLHAGTGPAGLCTEEDRGGRSRQAEPSSPRSATRGWPESGGRGVV